MKLGTVILERCLSVAGLEPIGNITTIAYLGLAS